MFFGELLGKGCLQRRPVPLTQVQRTGIQWDSHRTESPFGPQVKFPLVCSVVLLAVVAAAVPAVAAVLAVAVSVVVVVAVAAAVVVVDAAAVAVDDGGGGGPMSWHPEQLFWHTKRSHICQRPQAAF